MPSARQQLAGLEDGGGQAYGGQRSSHRAERHEEVVLKLLLMIQRRVSLGLGLS